MVKSNQNQADKLTRVPEMERERTSKTYLYIILVSKYVADQIRSLHCESGHPQHQTVFYKVDWSCAFESSFHGNVSYPAQWPRGKLDVSDIWIQVGIDINHYDDRHYLMWIDCGLTIFTIWWQLCWQDSANMINHFKFSNRSLLLKYWQGHRIPQ